MNEENFEKKALEHLAVGRICLETISSEVAKSRKDQKSSQNYIIICTGITALATVAMAVIMLIH